MVDQLTLPHLSPPPGAPRLLAPGAWLLPGFALGAAPALFAAAQAVIAQAPLRRMQVPGGGTMAVAITNCGALGWVSDATGYRYAQMDPESDAPWPDLPEAFRRLAEDAAAQAGYPGFAPDACLINRYAPGAGVSLHQDKNERDFDAPIVSISLGLPATFLFGGLTRKARPEAIPLIHGDVAVWGGPSRLRYHGIRPIKAGAHPLTGACRMNLTLRQAG